MNWSRLRSNLVACHPHQPQQVARIDQALQLARDAIALLQLAGHQFHLAEGPAKPLADWPRLMYHFEKAQAGHLVLCQEDLELLGDGWFDTLDEAKHANGMGQQFRRGGIFPKRGLPALPLDFPLTRLDKESRNGSE